MRNQLQSHGYRAEIYQTFIAQIQHQTILTRLEQSSIQKLILKETKLGGEGNKAMKNDRNVKQSSTAVTLTPNAK